MSSLSNNRPIYQVRSLETLKLSRLSEKDLSADFSIKGLCTSNSIHTAARAQCRICFDKPRRGQSINHQVQGDLKLGKIEFDNSTFRCGDRKLGDYQAADLKSKDEILRRLDELRKISYPEKSPVQFKENGEPYSNGIAQERSRMFIRYQTCLERGAMRRFKATPYDCLRWLKEYGRSSLPKFEFLQTDDFFPGSPNKFDKNFGFFTREILALSCKRPNYKKYSISVVDHEPKLKMECHSKNGVWKEDPTHRFATFYKNEAISAELSFFKSCENLKSPKAEEGTPASN